MKLNFKKRDPVMPDTNLGPPKTQLRNKTLARAISVALLAGSILPATGFAGSFQGSMYNDLNGNGTKESGEQGQAGLEVYIRSHQTGKVSTVTTDKNGDFLSEGHDSGRFVLWVQQQSGWQQTNATARTRASKFYTVVLNEGENHTVDFGVIKTDAPMINTDGPTVVELNTEVTFSVDIVPDDPDNPDDIVDIDTIVWDFGDGNTAVGQNATHTYTSVGNYQVSVTVTDINGEVSTAIWEVIVTVFGSGDPCNLTTAIFSDQDGDWNEITTWSTGTVPTSSDSVKVDHEINADGFFFLDQLCVLENGKLEGVNLDILADKIHNYGQILGVNGNSASGGITNRLPAEVGGNVTLSASTLLNESTGQIYAGRGGDDITILSFTGEMVDATGVTGGTIGLYGFTDIINHGRIGPRRIDWWDHGISKAVDYQPLYGSDPFGDTANGGNGGDGINVHIYDVRNWYGDGDQTNFNNGDAIGGNGGNTFLQATSVFNDGRICSGNGGPAATAAGLGGSGWPTGGIGGTLTISSPNVAGSGTFCSGRGGDVWIEPDMLIIGPNARIIGENITQYGGDNFEMVLSNLQEGAITAEKTITLAVGKNGVIDFRGNAAQVLKAGIQVLIFADTVLLDDGVTLENVIDAPSIVVKPSKIIYHAELSGPGQVNGKAGATLPIKLTLLNSAAVSDTFTLTVIDVAGWNLGTLSNTVTLDSLKSTNMTLDVMLPKTLEATDTITVMATSQADTTVVATTKIRVKVDKEPNLAVELADFTAIAEDGGIRLDWETASEIDNAGFFIVRARKDENGKYTEVIRITKQAIPSVYGSINGTSYYYVDSSVVSGNTYYYALEDIEFSGKTTRHLELIDSATAK
ncbi:MAG: hypothetical protein DRR19_27180 [Candidatus Parabeggiatoa sp. nov. 1]|nr:MAG: hypothetical protein DRR19_27180 [Gammaproteobacteria bacterium]